MQHGAAMHMDAIEGEKVPEEFRIGRSAGRDREEPRGLEFDLPDIDDDYTMLEG